MPTAAGEGDKAKPAQPSEVVIVVDAAHGNRLPGSSAQPRVSVCGDGLTSAIRAEGPETITETSAVRNLQAAYSASSTIARSKAKRESLTRSDQNVTRNASATGTRKARQKTEARALKRPNLRPKSMQLKRKGRPSVELTEQGIAAKSKTDTVTLSPSRNANRSRARTRGFSIDNLAEIK